MVASYFIAACFAAVVYDWALTFGQEIELVWRQHWSLMTVLYFSLRYLGMPLLLFQILVSVPSNPVIDVECTIYAFVVTAMSIIINAMLCVIMIFRLHAMYSQSRKILIFLAVVVVSFNIVYVVMFIMDANHIKAEALVTSGTHMCIVMSDPPLLIAVTWILRTVWEVLALCFSIWIAVKHFLELQRPSIGWAVGDLFRALVKTHIFYFTAFVAVSCFTLGTLLNSTSDVYFGFLSIATVVQQYILGPRLIIGVREYHAKLVADSDTGVDMGSTDFQEHIHISTSSSV